MPRLTTRQKECKKASKNRSRRKRKASIKKYAFGAIAAFAVGMLATGSFKALMERSFARWYEQASFGIESNLRDSGMVLSSIKVYGREKTDAGQISRMVGMQRGDSILSSSVEDIRRRVESISTVRSASVQRYLPGQLVIRVQERRPAAIWQYQGELHVIDDEGVLLNDEAPEDNRHLLVVVGKDASEHFGGLRTLLQRHTDLSNRVTAAVRVGERRWDLRLKGGVRVLLPEDNPMDAWHRLAELQERQQLLDRSLELIDFRIDKRIFIRMQPGAKEQQPEKSEEA